MSEMPERIWARPDNKTWALDEIKSKVGDWFPFHSFEYVRADIVKAKDAEIASLTESERILSEQIMELRDEVMRLRQGEPSMTLRNFREMQAEIKRLSEENDDMKVVMAALGKWRGHMTDNNYVAMCSAHNEYLRNKEQKNEHQV